MSAPDSAQPLTFDPSDIDDEVLDNMLGSIGPNVVGGAGASAIAKIIDDKLDFTTLIKGPVGQALEAIDRPIITALLTLGFTLGVKAAGGIRGGDTDDSDKG